MPAMTYAELTEAFLERGDAIERVRALADAWEFRAPLCRCEPCLLGRKHADAIRAALEERS